jgi:hypothetical protein
VNPPPRFLTGCKLESPHQRSLYAPAVHVSHPGALFRSVGSSLSYGLISLARHAGKIFDQGPTESCEGHRGSMAVQIALRASGVEPPFVPSPRASYANARLYERTRGPNGSLPALKDEGCATGDYLRGLSEIGIEAMGPEVDGRYSDCGPNNVNQEPSLSNLAVEGQNLVVGAYDASNLDLFSTLLAIQASLAAGYPVGLDIVADTIFQMWGSGWGSNTAPLTTVNTDDPSAGGHAIVCDEMSVGTDGSIILGGPNSWGQWGAPAIDGSGEGYGRWRATPDWLQKANFAVTVFKCSLKEET